MHAFGGRRRQAEEKIIIHLFIHSFIDRETLTREMEKLPEDVMMQQILLKLPASSLVNLRYVSKDLWSLITSPSFIKFHSIAQLNNNPNPNSLLISCPHPFFVKRGDVKKKKIQLKIQNYDCNFPIITSTSSSTSPEIRPEIVEMHIPFESTEIRASCNGLLYLHQRLISFGIDGKKIDDILYYIWNPCTKEYKQLPPPPPPPLLLDGVDVRNLKNAMKYAFFDYSSSSGFCGFGYDSNNDEYKILHYENRVHPNDIVRADQVHELSSITEFKLYTLGTNTWTRIADNPYRSFYFKEPSKKIGLLVNGALHWIMSLSGPAPKAGKIIAFDIEKEVFREVQKPRYYDDSSNEEEHDQQDEEEDYYCESLQTLQECLCMCQVNFDGEVNKIDIWMLQDYGVMDSWTKLFKVVIHVEEFNYYQFRLLRYCENGEIVMLRNCQDVIVYDPVNHKARCAKKFNESAKYWKYCMDYTESLVCLNSSTYTDRAS